MPKIDILKSIVRKKIERIALAKQRFSEKDLIAKIQALGPARPFIEAVNKPRQLALIAEIKKASPSRGIIRQEFNIREIAEAYQKTGVNAISVLTEEDYFLGDISCLNEVKSVVGVPILRKDFILEPYQIFESRAFGADAVLLIASLLTKDELAEFTRIADSLGMDCLVEAHTEKELKKVLNCGFIPLIGINNRNLRTLDVDFKTTESLFPLIPKSKVVVVESGIKTRQDILFLKVLGVNAVLAGEVFMDAADIAKKVEEVMGW